MDEPRDIGKPQPPTPSMRALHVYRTYFPDPPGGLQEAIRQIALAARDFGVESRIFTLSPTPKPAQISRPEGLVTRCRSWAAPASCDLGGVAAFQRFRELVDWADVVHFHFPWPFADLLNLVAGRRDKPAVMTYQSDVVRQRLLGLAYRPLMAWMLKTMDAVVATSGAYARTSKVLSRYVSREKLRVIPLGIVESSYQEAIHASQAISLRERFGLETGGYFLAIGVLRYYKGFHTLIEAARNTSAPIVLAGDGPERTRLETLASALPRDKIRFLGRVSDAEKMALIAGCRAMVLPSHLRSEAFGMVLVEAAMQGRPLISCEIGTGTSFVNADGETGLVVLPEDPRALAAAIERLRTDEALWRHCADGARRRYERLFSGPALGQAYAELYRDVLAGRGRVPAHG